VAVFICWTYGSLCKLLSFPLIVYLRIFLLADPLFKGKWQKIFDLKGGTISKHPTYCLHSEYFVKTSSPYRYWEKSKQEKSDCAKRIVMEHKKYPIKIRKFLHSPYQTEWYGTYMDHIWDITHHIKPIWCQVLPLYCLIYGKATYFVKFHTIPRYGKDMGYGNGMGWLPCKGMIWKWYGRFNQSHT